MILAHILQKDISELYFSCPELSPKQEQEAMAIVQKRLLHWPLCKLLGEKGFYKYNFAVSEDVLSPRPDTEILVEAAIKCAKEVSAQRILDLGTGSGCIVLSVLADVDSLQGVAVDVSAKALQIAEKNAQNLGLRKRVRFVNKSWFDADFVSVLGQDFDIIVSNPPYIPSKDIAGLDSEVKEHDPLLALDGGADGLVHYRKIAKTAFAMLKAGGFIFLEGGIDQEKQIADIFEQAGFSLQHILKDYGGINRCIILKK